MAQTKKKLAKIYLKDYQVPDFEVDSLFLHFELADTRTVVKAVASYRRHPQGKPDAALTLNGEAMQLETVLLDGKALSLDQYQVDDYSLTIAKVPDQFTLETTVIIKPQENTTLSGLYTSRGNYCTQCESHGFRRITYYLDRPDVMTKFTVAITADKKRYPVLLSNGNLVEEKELGDRRWVKWEDPSKKPCYLFALVAGDYDCLADTFTTMNGREITLQLYVEKGNLGQAEFAMQSLKNAMKWDEQAFGREYDLDMYMVVAVSDFNMGAMENKGLNIFNSVYILAKPETATDNDYINIQAVIGHEYFHNWSGNRITCRDWFQITLKEGLTVVREQLFSADMFSQSVKRIQDARMIRSTQFAQDASPMAHPIRPDSYIEINNFYTVTVYEKGAEVIRMIRTILGPELFRKGMDLYFERHDGEAVTTDDFVQAMQDASNIDLTQFKRWYSQSGTPQLTVTDAYDKQSKTYSLTVKQHTPATADQAKKQALHIPFIVALLNANGKEIAEQQTHNITEDKQTISYNTISEKPIPSLLRDFSAPVKVNYDYSDDDLLLLMAHDTDGFNRWDAGQQMAAKYMLQNAELPDTFIQAFKKIINDKSDDGVFIGEMLLLPSLANLIERVEQVDIEALHAGHHAVRLQLAKQCEQDLLKQYHAQHAKGKYVFDKAHIGKRKIKNMCLSYLLLLDKQEYRDLAYQQFEQANNMTDAMGALGALNNVESKQRTDALAKFYQQWKNELLVVDKWLALQAGSELSNTLETVKQLMQHESFDIKNPNKVRALIGVFAHRNLINFHAKDGKGYQFLVDNIIKIDSMNPQIAARLIDPLIRWRRFDKQRQALMQTQLKRLAAVKTISPDVYEIVDRSLNG